MKSSFTRELIRKIAENEGLTIKQVEQIVNAPFRLTKKLMSEGNRKDLIFATIRVFKFGVFKVKEGKKIYIRQGYEKFNRSPARKIRGRSRSNNDKGVQENLESGPFDKEG